MFGELINSFIGVVCFITASRQVKQIKGLDLISGLELAFRRSLTGGINAGEGCIIRLQKLNEFIRAIEKYFRSGQINKLVHHNIETTGNTEEQEGHIRLCLKISK